MTTTHRHMKVSALSLWMTLAVVAGAYSQNTSDQSGKTMTEIAALMDRMTASQATLDTEVRRASADVEVDVSAADDAVAKQQHEEKILQRLRREGAGNRAPGQQQRAQSDPQGTEADLAQRADAGGAYESDPRTRKAHLKRLVKEQKILKKHREELEVTAKALQKQMDEGGLRPSSQAKAEKEMSEVNHYLDELDKYLAQHRGKPKPGAGDPPAEAQKN